MNGKEFKELKELLHDCNNESGEKELDGSYTDAYYELTRKAESNAYEKIWYLVDIISEIAEHLKTVKTSDKGIREFIKEYGDK